MRVLAWGLGHLSLKLLRFVNAKRLFRVEVAGDAKCTGSAAHADLLKFAIAALAFKVIEVAQVVEKFGIVPNFGEALVAQVAGFQEKLDAAPTRKITTPLVTALSTRIFGSWLHLISL